MKTARLWLLEGIMVTKKDRDYHALSMSDTLSARWEYCTESMILSAHTDTLSVHLSMCWQYHTLSTASWGACWEYQRALRVLCSQRHTLSVRWEYHSRWEYEYHFESIIVSACGWDSYSMLRVLYSQCILRLWWYSQRMLILLACASSCAESIILSALHTEAYAESISVCWDYHTLCIILSACAESISYAESMILSRWEYLTLKD